MTMTEQQLLVLGRFSVSRVQAAGGSYSSDTTGECEAGKRGSKVFRSPDVV
jgi:hypothetical protein